MRVSSFPPNIVAKITAIQLQLSELIRIELTQKWGQLDWDGKISTKAMKAFQKINRTTPQLKYIWMDLDALFFNTPIFQKKKTI